MICKVLLHGLLDFIYEVEHLFYKNNCRATSVLFAPSKHLSFYLEKNEKNTCATQKLHIYLQPQGCVINLQKMKQDIFQAIADPTRRAILTLLAIQALTPNVMAEKFDMTRQAVSKHIKVLHQCDLIKPEHNGREIYYHFNAKKMQEFDNWVAQFRQNWETQFNQLDKLLTTIKTQQ